VIAILKGHPQYATYLAPPQDSPEGQGDLGLRTFLRGAIWPDLIRTGRGKDREFHHPEWHYVDFPILADGIDRDSLELPPTGDKIEEGKPAQNILQALAWSVDRLRDADTPAAQRGVALAWLVHLVGDVHQPLHCCAMFSPAYPKGDRGGNLFMVKYHGNVINLHAFWDELLGGYIAPRLVDAVADKVLEAHPRDSLAKELASTKFTDWSAESFAIARDVCYAGGKLKGLTREANAADKGATTPELPEGYDKTARDIARTRAALAGYRLADLLNAALDPQ
jgi:hypothetical protein